MYICKLEGIVRVVIKLHARGQNYDSFLYTIVCVKIIYKLYIVRKNYDPYIHSRVSTA